MKVNWNNYIDHVIDTNLKLYKTIVVVKEKDPIIKEYEEILKEKKTDVDLL